MAKRKDTLTIILSDHGPKTTVYSQDYLHGRYETYDSLSFMIIPKKVQHGLGESRMASLVRNQKSLITMQDIHEMLTEMTQLHKRKRKSALFSDISKQTCDSIQMISYGVCKCRDWERLFIDQSPRFIQLAEFATELLNDKVRFSQRYINILNNNHVRVELYCESEHSIMHLSMLGRRGGRRGKGAGFDGKVYPVSGEFDNQYSPGGRGI